MTVKLTDFALTTLAAAPAGTTGVTLTVAPGAGAKFPALTGGNVFPAVIESADGSSHEAVTVTARTGDGMTITRSASPVAWSGSGQNFYLALTADAVTRLMKASEHTVVPAGNLTSTDVQAALEELSTEATSLASTKAPIDAPVFTTSVTLPGDATSALQAVPKQQLDAAGVTVMSNARNQAGQAFTTAGTAPAFTVTTSPTYGALAVGQRMYLTFHADGTTPNNTLDRDGTGSKNLKQFARSGAKIPANIRNGQPLDVVYDGTDYVVLNPLPIEPQIFNIAASAASPNLTVTLAVGTVIHFRSSTLNSGSISVLTTTTPTTLTLGSGVTLGTTNGTAARLAVIAFNDAGTVRLGITNLAGGLDLDETGLLTFSSTITGTTTALYANGGTYSNCPYRVVGVIDSTQASAGTWATQPTLVQGMGGQATPTVSAQTALNRTTLGYQRLSGGMIIQWGSATAVGSSGTITFPIAFPTACISAVSAQHSTSATQYSAMATPGLSSVVFYGGGSNISIYWIAIGY